MTATTTSAPGLPRLPLLGCIAVVVLAVGLIAVARFTDRGAVRMVDGPVVASIDLTFADRDDGTVVVASADGREIERLAPGADGFIRGIMRGLARERRLGPSTDAPAGPDVPFRLTRGEHGRLTIADPVTGRRYDLNAFGFTNAATFARFLPAPSGGRS